MKSIIQFILGQCGHGKTTKVYKIIKEKIKNCEKKIVLLVPEQISFENEKNLLNFLGNKDFNKVKVLSFNRIFDFISRILGISLYEKLTGVSEIILMALALEESKPNLQLFFSDVFESETILKMLKIVEKFKSAKIDSSILAKLYLNANKKIFRQKLNEYKIILENYEKLVKKYVDKPLEDLDVVIDLIKNNEIFSDYIILVDEFTGFTPKQFEILELLISQAKEIFFAFCLNKDFETEDDFCLFAPVNKIAKNIINIAKNQKSKIEPTILLDKNLRCLNDDLKSLEENMFSSAKQMSEIIPENIEIYNAEDVYEECDYVARRIKKLIFENDYRYKDFVVVTRNIEEYAENFKNIFQKYDIPCFVSYPQKITEVNLIVFVISVLEVINTNFETNEILRLLKTGFCGISIEEIAFLENYVILWEINKKNWLSDFTFHPEGFAAKFTEENVKKLAEINRIKNLFIENLVEFRKKINYTTGEKISEAIYDLLLKFDMKEHIQKKCTDFLAQNKLILAQTLSKSWDILMNILSEFHKILKNRKISLKEYAELLYTAILQEEISFIPQSIDDVTIGSIEKIKLSSPKIVFAVGAVSSEFPKTTVGDFEFFTNDELKIFAENKAPFGDSAEEIILKERFLAYTAISAPMKKLFISWPNSNISGSGKLPSEIVMETLTIFPHLNIISKKDENELDFLWSEKSAFEILAKNFKLSNETLLCLKKIFSEKKNYKEKIKLIENASKKKTLNFEKSENAEEFFAGSILISASQVEKFYRCRFGYFCEYGLKAKSQQVAKFNALEHGNFIHYILEKILKKYLNEKFYEINLSVLKNEIDFFSQKFVNEKLGGWENKPKKFEIFFEKCKLTAEILLNRFKEEFSQSEFSYIDCELVISENGDIKPMNLKLPDGGEIKVEGKIDRVDTMTKNDKTYVRIVDYKTGKKDFSLSDVVFGLNMQMLLYLFTILKNGESRYKNSVPAGILYMPSVFPVISGEINDSNDEIIKKISKKLCMNGLILEDVNVIEGMERDVKGLYIPVSVNDGQIKKSNSIISKKELEIIANHIEKKLINMAISLKKGEISAIPVKGENSACEWCEFKAICGFEDDDFIDIPSISKDEALRIMSEEGENND